MKLPSSNGPRPSPCPSGDNAGLIIAGDSRSGKSNAMRLLVQRVIQAGYRLTLFDPYDDPARVCLEDYLR